MDIDTTINLIAAILAFATSFYLLALARKSLNGLRRGFMLTGLGVLIALAIHSSANFIREMGYLSMQQYSILESVTIITGSILLLAGVYILYHTIKQVAERKSDKK